MHVWILICISQDFEDRKLNFNSIKLEKYLGGAGVARDCAHSQ